MVPASQRSRCGQRQEVRPINSERIDEANRLAPTEIATHGQAVQGPERTFTLALARHDAEEVTSLHLAKPAQDALPHSKHRSASD
jgi:hypothetical protein